MGLVFSVITSSVDEVVFRDETPDDFVCRMAREKSVVPARDCPESWVISGDTVVCRGADILGKPADQQDAVSMLMSLSGIEHRVKTGLCVACVAENISIVRVVTTKVLFSDFSETVARAYVASGECFDKAGSYGIQGKGAFLVKTIEGSYSNVVGLPLTELLNILLEHQVISACR
jgi:septum formation protein